MTKRTADADEQSQSQTGDSQPANQPPTPAAAPVVRYVGNGTHLIGVPTRDLSADEAEQYGGVDALLATALYARID